MSGPTAGTDQILGGARKVRPDEICTRTFHAARRWMGAPRRHSGARTQCGVLGGFAAFRGVLIDQMNRSLLLVPLHIRRSERAGRSRAREGATSSDTARWSGSARWGQRVFSSRISVVVRERAH
jgi:hypothetical protein